MQHAAALALHEDGEVGRGGEVGGAELLEQDDDRSGPRGEGELDLGREAENFKIKKVNQL